jgi:hypothetical protein
MEVQNSEGNKNSSHGEPGFVNEQKFNLQSKEAETNQITKVSEDVCSLEQTQPGIKGAADISQDTDGSLRDAVPSGENKNGALFSGPIEFVEVILGFFAMFMITFWVVWFLGPYMGTGSMWLGASLGFLIFKIVGYFQGWLDGKRKPQSPKSILM